MRSFRQTEANASTVVNISQLSLGIAIPGSRIPGSRDPGPFSQSRIPGLPTSKSRDFGIEKLLENQSFSVIK